MNEDGSRTSSPWIRGLIVVGVVLVASGVVVVSFVLFMVYGTAVIQRSHQDSLRQEFERTIVVRTAASGPPRALLPAPQPIAGAPVAELVIPAIGLNMIVVQGTAEPDLEQGPGHYVGTPLPGEVGNVGIAGHRTTWARPFYNLNDLVSGDRIVTTTARGTFTYRVTSLFTVAPTDLTVLKPSSRALITLTTCTPRYSAAQRLIVRGVLTSSSLTPTRDVRTVTHYSALVAQGSPSPWPAVVLGLATLGALGLTLTSLRLSRGRWVALSLGGVLCLVLLLATFTFAAPLLPANL